MKLKKSIILFLLFQKLLLHGQTICNIKDATSIENIDFTAIKFSPQISVVDSVSYNVIATCWRNKAKILGNLDKNGNKQGQFIIYDNKGAFLVEGSFSNNLMDGWWYYAGCCKTKFNAGKKLHTVCITF